MTIQASGDDCRESGEGETSRRQFEEYFEEAYGWDSQEYPDQTYVAEVWSMWQASRSAIEISMPPLVITAEIGPAVSLEKMMARLAVNGIKVKTHEQRNPPQA